MRLVIAMVLAPTIGAAAACPSAGDLESGVRIEISTGAYSEHKLIDTHTVKVDEYGIDGSLYRTQHFSQLVLETKTVGYDFDSQEVSYSSDFYYKFDLPLKIESGAGLSGIQFGETSDGEEFQSEYTINFSSRKRIKIGQCEYAYLEVTKQYAWSGDGDEETVIYLAELGVLIEIEPIPYNLDLLRNGNIKRL